MAKNIAAIPLTIDRIAAYLKTRTTPATSREIATGSHSNHNTVRKLLGVMLRESTPGRAVQHAAERKCKKSGLVVSTYKPRAVVQTAPARIRAKKSR